MKASVWPMYVVAAICAVVTMALVYVFFLGVPAKIAEDDFARKLLICGIPFGCGLAALRAAFAERKYEADEAKRAAAEAKRVSREQRAFANARKGLEPPPAPALPQPPRIGADPFREPPARAPIVVERPTTAPATVPRADDAAADRPKVLG